MAILSLIAPVFGVLLLGFIAARRGWFDSAANNGLSLFVFNFAIPPLLFRNMALADLPATWPLAYLFSYFGVAFLMYGLGYWGTRQWFNRDHNGASICAFSVSYGNTVLLGIPLTLLAFGKQAAVPLFLLLTFHSPLLMGTITLSLQSKNIAHSLLGIVKNPIVAALLLGFTWNSLALPLPDPVNELLKLLGQAAAPCALFATGAALSQYRIAGNLGESLYLLGLKNILQPILVWVLASQVFHLPDLWTAVSVLIAALPTGVNAYLFAQRYNIGIATATTTIFLSTTLALFTLPLVLWWLGVG